MIHFLSDQEFTSLKTKIDFLEELTDKQEAKKNDLLKHINRLEAYITEQHTKTKPDESNAVATITTIAIILVTIVFIYISFKNPTLQENG